MLAYKKKPYEEEYTLEYLNGIKKTRKQASFDGDRHYFSGDLCKSNHLSLRYVSSNRCIKCWQESKVNRTQHISNIQKKYYQKNKELYRKHRETNIEYHLWLAAKHRAKRKNLEFDIEASDIKIPEKCPVFGVNIDIMESKRTYSPSIDRFDNTKGYTKNNIRVISTKANKLKNNATLQELKQIISYMEKSENN